MNYFLYVADLSEEDPKWSPKPHYYSILGGELVTTHSGHHVHWPSMLCNQVAMISPRFNVRMTHIYKTTKSFKILCRSMITLFFFSGTFKTFDNV